MNLRTALLFLAFAVIFVDTVGYQIVIPSLPLFREKLQLTEIEAGIIYASYGVASLLLYIPFGALVDRFGRRIFILSGLLLLSLSSLLFAFSDTFFELLLSRTLQGISATSTWAGIIPFVANISEKEERGVSMAGIGVAYSMGSILGPAFGGAGELRTPFSLFSIAPFLLFLLFLFLPQPAYEHKKVDAETNFLHLLKDRNLLIACISIAVCFFALGAMEVLLPLNLYKFQVSKLKIGIGFAVLGVISALFQLLSGWWSDRRGRIEPILFGLLSGAIVVPFLGQIEELKALLVLFVPLAFAFATALTPTLPLIADSVPQRKLGVAYGIYNTLFSIGLVGGSVIVPSLTQSYGINSGLYLISSLMLIAGASIWLIADRR